jgi:hypothetical protein
MDATSDARENVILSAAKNPFSWGYGFVVGLRLLRMTDLA